MKTSYHWVQLYDFNIDLLVTHPFLIPYSLCGLIYNQMGSNLYI